MTTTAVAIARRIVYTELLATLAEACPITPLPRGSRCGYSRAQNGRR